MSGVSTSARRGLLTTGLSLVLLATGAAPLFAVSEARTALPRVADDVAEFRRPGAIERLDEAAAVVVGRSGSLIVVDLAKWQRVAEYRIGGQLTDIARIPNSDREDGAARFAITDAGRSRLVIVEVSRDAAHQLAELPLPTGPVTVRVSADGKSCSVSCLWARKFVFVRLNDESSDVPVIETELAMPFSPREQLHAFGGERIVVADGFSGQLAIVGAASHDIQAVHRFGAHNIRGLALRDDGKSLLVSHQLLNDLAIPRRSDIVWGVMVDNLVRVSQIDKLLVESPGAMHGGRYISAGYAGQGAGDPDSLFVDEQGRTIVALAGVGEVTIVSPDGNAFRRVAVGRRPVALLPVSAGRFVVVNELSDSLSLVDLNLDIDEAPPELADSVAYADDYDDETGSYGSTYLDTDVLVAQLKLGTSPEPGRVERGEQLFFDARLSHANWFSCHSCHTDGHSNGGRADTFGDSTTGAPKRVLSLLGVGDTRPWGWNGAKPSLLDQVHQSAESTMRGRGLQHEQAEDLAAYLQTLEPPPPFMPPVDDADRQVVQQGRAVFETQNCHQCHSGHTLTSSDAYDVGLEDERGLKEFNPPSLRGVGHRLALFHDKRAASVEDVVVKFEHQITRPLSDTDRTALLRYLKSL